MKKQKKKNYDKLGMTIPAGLLIGLGIGLLIGKVVALLLIGLGLGFLGGLLSNKK